MSLFLATTLIFAAAIAAMGIGLITGRGPLDGGCSGSAAECDACSRACRRRSGAMEQ